jgi:hypothetical protein
MKRFQVVDYQENANQNTEMPLPTSEKQPYSMSMTMQNTVKDAEHPHSQWE